MKFVIHFYLMNASLGGQKKYILIRFRKQNDTSTVIVNPRSKGPSRKGNLPLKDIDWSLDIIYLQSYLYFGSKGIPVSEKHFSSPMNALRAMFNYGSYGTT